MERDTGIGSATKLWESFVMPFHQSRISAYFTVLSVTVDNCEYENPFFQVSATRFMK